MTEWKVRKVEDSDLKRYKELTDIEGWNYGQGRILCNNIFEVYFTDMFDFVFGSKGQAYCLELNGKLVSFCGYFELSKDAFLGISYVTDKEYRGMGYGSECIKAVIGDYNGKNCKPKVFINSGKVYIPKWAG